MITDGTKVWCCCQGQKSSNPCIRIENIIAVCGPPTKPTSPSIKLVFSCLHYTLHPSWLYGHEYGSESERELQEMEQCSEKQVMATAWNCALFFPLAFWVVTPQARDALFINVVASSHRTVALQSIVNIYMYMWGGDCRTWKMVNCKFADWNENVQSLSMEKMGLLACERKGCRESTWRGAWMPRGQDRFQWHILWRGVTLIIRWEKSVHYWSHVSAMLPCPRWRQMLLSFVSRRNILSLPQ
jgi:hypothetical protein